MTQIEINNIDDLIYYVETDVLKDLEPFCKAIEATLNVLCFADSTTTKAQKIEALKIWRAKYLNSDTRPLFFLTDPLNEPFD